MFAFIGLTVADPESAQLAGFLFVFPLVFASSVFVSIRSMPGWLQAFANAQPITRAANAVRALTEGGPNLCQPHLDRRLEHRHPGRVRPPGGPPLPQGLAPPGAGSRANALTPYLPGFRARERTLDGLARRPGPGTA